MEVGFVGRSMRTYGIVLLIYSPFGLYYFGAFPTIAVLSGGVWGIANLIFLTALVKAVIRPDGVQTERAVVYGLIKFPLLYGAAYALLKVEQFDPWWLLAGFTGVLAIMILKAVGRVLLGLDNNEKKRLQSAL